MNPKVSIVVPCYDVEKYLDRCVRSLVNQTLKDVEIILVDDKSNDRTPEICDGWSIRDSRIKVFHKKINEGLGEACNSGMLMSSGEYIAFCDSDDWVTEDMYASLYKIAVSNGADAVYSGIQTVNGKGEIRVMNSYSKFEVVKDKDRIYNCVMDMIASESSCKEERKMAMSAKIVLYKKSLIDYNKLRFVSEREIVSEDLVWNIDVLCNASCIVLTPQIFYNYYVNPSSISNKINLNKFSLFKIQRAFLLNMMEKYDMPKECSNRIERMFIGYSRYYIGQIIKSQLPISDKHNVVSCICRDEVWKKVYSMYPVKNMRFIPKLMFVMMLNDTFWLMFFVYRILSLFQRK